MTQRFQIEIEQVPGRWVQHYKRFEADLNYVTAYAKAYCRHWGAGIRIMDAVTGERTVIQ